MNFIKNFDWSFKSIAKILGIVLLVILGLAFITGLLSLGYQITSNNMRPMEFSEGYGVSMNSDATYDYRQESAPVSSKMTWTKPVMPEPDYSTGGDAEAFEVKTYSGTIKTRQLDETCDTMAILKDEAYVIFEDSNKNENSCYYRFKVEKNQAEEIVKIIQNLKPETLNVNAQSIRPQLESTEDEMIILQKKLDSIEETLEGAQSAYDEITRLATRQNDTETLAKIIDSKLNLIERLTTQRIEVKTQIDRYSEEKVNQLDRLNYAFFNISVFKDVMFDWKGIKNSWKFETKNMIDTFNHSLQGVTLGMVTYLIIFSQIVLYLFLSLFILKFVWRGVKKIWRSEFKKEGIKK